jgi:hypothetical protein
MRRGGRRKEDRKNRGGGEGEEKRTRQIRGRKLLGNRMRKENTDE